MSERRRVSSKPSRDVIVRYHSPYCEATGPIVQEGTVAARIQALQNAQRRSEKTARPLTPVSHPPTCRLTPDWRPYSALGSPVSAVSRGSELQGAHAQLIDYVRNESGLREEVATGIVRNKTLMFGTPSGTPRSRQRSLSTPGNRSRIPELSDDDEGSPRVASPRLTRHSSWKKSIGQASPVRSRKSISNVVQIPESQPSTPPSRTVTRQDTWPEKTPVLRKTPANRVTETSKHPKPQKSIVEQIGEMIDRALEGRSESAGPSTMSRSASVYTTFSGGVRRGKHNYSEQPRYLDQYRETPADISSGTAQAVRPQGSGVKSSTREQAFPHKTGSMCSSRFDGRYSHTEETAYPRSDSDIADNAERIPSPEPVVAPTPTRLRAQSYSHRHRSIRQDERHAVKVIRARSVSTPPSSSSREEFGDDHHYEMYVRKHQERGVAGPDEDDSNLESDRSRRQSLRSHGMKPRHRASSHHLSEKPHLRSPRQKKWKWWKLVLVDQDGSRTGQSTTQGNTETAGSEVFRHGSHPLANNEQDDEGYETSDLFEALNRACTGQLLSAVMTTPGRKGKLSGLATHTLVECGHEDEKGQTEVGQVQGDVRLAVDGSSDSQRSRPTLTIASSTEAAASCTQVNVVSEAHGARVEVKAGESRGQGEDGNHQGVQVVVTVEEGMDSAVVMVKISPKKKKKK